MQLERVCRVPRPWLISVSLDLMRLAVLLVALFAAVSLSRARDITSRELVGKWTGRIDAYGEPTRYSFRADHSFDVIGGDTHWAGKWKLQPGNKLELITHYDYDP